MGSLGRAAQSAQKVVRLQHVLYVLVIAWGLHLPPADGGAAGDPSRAVAVDKRPLKQY